MGMVCMLQALTPQQISELLTEPSLADDLMVAVPDAAREKMFAEFRARATPEQRARIDEMEAQRKAATAAFPGAEAYLAREADAKRRIGKLGELASPLDLQKSWHMLHYAITGDAQPGDSVGDFLLTGRPVGEGEGYGPAMLHTPGETQAFAAFLEKQSLEGLLKRVNIVEMRRVGVYAMPFGPDSDTESEKELREEVASAFTRLRTYLDHAAANGNGLLISVT